MLGDKLSLCFLRLCQSDVNKMYDMEEFQKKYYLMLIKFGFSLALLILFNKMYDMKEFPDYFFGLPFTLCNKTKAFTQNYSKAKDGRCQRRANQFS